MEPNSSSLGANNRIPVGGQQRKTLGGKTVGKSSGVGVVGSQYGGRGDRSRGLGRGKTFKRHRKLLRDNIQGITKGDIRRMARRGGVKRISSTIYEEARGAIKAYLERVLHDCVAVLEYSSRKTVTVTDVIFTLRRQGRPIYGFDKDTAPVKTTVRK
ncbi:histone-fold-containing protein [Tricladium varicosporioides]|nr:histone-fold-containing protein [Hymenoscyphus varicosporioides]